MRIFGRTLIAGWILFWGLVLFVVLLRHLLPSVHVALPYAFKLFMLALLFASILYVPLSLYSKGMKRAKA